MLEKKRKRNDHLADRTEPRRGDVRLQEQYIENVLQGSKQLLAQALKLARGFERQKLGRRQNSAKAADNDSDSKRLVAEIKALKTLDINSIAENHLYKSLLHSKPIASAPAFPSNLQARVKENTKPNDAAQANVQARLFNSQPVKKAMDDTLSRVCSGLGLEDVQHVRKKRRRKKDFQRQLETTHRNDLECAIRTKPESLLRTSTLHLKTKQTSDDSSTEDHSELEKYKKLLKSSNETSDCDSISIDYDALRKTSAGTLTQELSLSPSPMLSSMSTATDSSPLRKNKASEKPPSTSKATRFLPSLSMGGYWSGSEPASDNEGSLYDRPRKNRRGQRERRLIAEKKFGQNAKHVTQQGRVQDRDRGWDARKGAQTEETDQFGRMVLGRGKDRSTRMRLKGSQPAKRVPVTSSGANSDPVGPRKPAIKAKSVEGSLHPSWQAAKKAKEQKQTATFQGKRMTFE
ncbi:MAG: hypothetical protein LQ339_001628 [Xanthoria mediterranea]|nr:MAG: hypothetical protein LQ339_001628 [Xanthoria mediterranea]